MNFCGEEHGWYCDFGVSPECMPRLPLSGWNYTTLKQGQLWVHPIHRIIPLRNYTTLKHRLYADKKWMRIIPLRNYTTLKLIVNEEGLLKRIIPLRNYTTLKLVASIMKKNC